MQKKGRRLLCLVFALAVTLCISVCAMAAEKTITLKTLPDTFLYVMQDAHPLVDKGPVAISEATLTENGEETPVYFVALHGTEVTALGEAADMISDVQVGLFESDNKYTSNAKANIYEDVPKGSNLIIAGHSLGGMSAQMLAADPDLKKDYNILYTTAIASPLIMKDAEKEGTVNRLADNNDLVPKLSIYTLTDNEAQKSNVYTTDSDYNMFTAHTGSYDDADLWGTYDAVGTPNGNATLTVNASSTKTHASPMFGQSGTRYYFAMPKDDNNYQGISIQL